MFFSHDSLHVSVCLFSYPNQEIYTNFVLQNSAFHPVNGLSFIENLDFHC